MRGSAGFVKADFARQRNRRQTGSFNQLHRHRKVQPRIGKRNAPIPTVRKPAFADVRNPVNHAGRKSCHQRGTVLLGGGSRRVDGTENFNGNRIFRFQQSAVNRKTVLPEHIFGVSDFFPVQKNIGRRINGVKYQLNGSVSFRKRSRQGECF